MKSIPYCTSIFKSLLIIISLTLGLLSSQVVMAQPANDLCTGAIALSINPGSCLIPTNCTINVNTGTDSGELPLPNCSFGGAYNGADIWYSMVVPDSGELSIETLDDGSGLYDTVMELYSGACGALVAIECDVDGGGVIFGFSLLEVTGLTAGSTVFLRVFEFGGNQSGTFDICAWDPNAQANDLCTGAITVPVDEGSCTSPPTIGTNVGATDSGEVDPCPPLGYSGGDVWYEFTMPSGQSTLYIDLITEISGGALVVELYDLSLGSCGSLDTAVVYCANFLDPNVPETIPGLTGGETYLLRIFENLNNAFGAFVFCLSTPPANDLCTGAITVPVDEGPCISPNTTGTNVGATDSQESPEPCGEGTYSGGDVWYEFTMPSGQSTLFIDLISPIPANTGDGLLHGQIYEGSCGSLSVVECSRFLSPNVVEEYAGLTGGNSYFLRLFEGQNNVFGSFQFCLRTRPANDLCAGAITVPVDVGPCTSGNTIGTNVETSDSQESPEPCGQGEYNGGDVWYEFTMPSGQSTLMVDLIIPIPPGPGGGLLHGQLYEGSCGSLSRVQCARFFSPNEVEIFTGLSADSTYLLRLFEGQNDRFGSFMFCLSTPPANDLCTDAITVPVDVNSCTSPNTTGTNINATDSGEVDICGGGGYDGGDVWYEFTMPAGETTLGIDLITGISGGNLHVELYDPSLGGCGSLNTPAVYCSNFLDPNVLEIIPDLAADSTYLLRFFEGQNDAFGTFVFCLSTPPPPPVNDLCTGAIPVTVDIGSCTSGNTTGTNVGATDSQESPAPCGNTVYGGGDVWYEFTMPAGETNLVIDLISPIPGGVLRGQLYEGSCGSLSSVLCASFLDPNGIAIYAGLTGGNTYFLRIFEGQNDVFGTFDFCLRTLAPPACATNEAAATDPSCETTDVVLSWDAVTDAAGYKITVGTSSGGVDIENNTDLLNVTSYTLVAPTVSTTYFWTVTPYNSAGDATACSEFSFTTAAIECYCPSVPISNDGKGITSTDVGTTTYPSTGDNVTYDDFTGGTVEQLGVGLLANCMITFETGFTYDTYIWIDFNDNFIFETSELVHSGESSSAFPTTYDASFLIPVGSTTGVHRMRIGTSDFGQNPPNPCFSGSFGVTEDFLVELVTPSCTQAVGTVALSSCDAGNGMFTIDVDVTDVGNGTVIISNDGGVPSTTVMATGVVNIGPFPTGTVTVSLEHPTDALCNVVLTPFTVPEGCYCPSVPSSIDGSGIASTDVGTTTYPSTGDVTYDDFTGGTVEQLEVGLLANCMITFETGFTYDTNIWIDFNDNIIFETSELLHSGESSSANPTTYDASFIIPAGSTTGVHRMRIGTSDFGQDPPNPCFSGSFGVTEDFLVDIICPTSLTLTGTNTGDDSNPDNIADNESSGLITSDQTIPANAIIDYDSATEIELLPGFNTVLGAVFEAFIDGCNNGAGGSNAQQNDNTNTSKK